MLPFHMSNAILAILVEQLAVPVAILSDTPQSPPVVLVKRELPSCAAHGTVTVFCTDTEAAKAEQTAADVYRIVTSYAPTLKSVLNLAACEVSSVGAVEVHGEDEGRGYYAVRVYVRWDGGPQ